MINHSKTTITKDDLLSVNQTINSGYLIKGSNYNSLEKLLCETFQFEYSRITNSGTLAFYKILRALNLNYDDEVLLPDYICNTLISPVQLNGLKVALYDNSDKNWLSNKEEILNKISDKTKVIVINHTFGFAFQELELLRKTISSKIHIIEDCCHAPAPGRIIGKIKLGEFSTCCFYSFNATKYITTGEGGAICSNNKEFIKELDKIKIGDNLSDINCALGITQINKLNEFIEKRYEIAQKYIKHFSYFISNKYNYEDSLFFRFPILTEDNSTFLAEKTVAFRQGVDSLLSFNLDCKHMPNAHELLHKIVSIPIYPSLTEEEINIIIRKTTEIINDSN